MTVEGSALAGLHRGDIETVLRAAADVALVVEPGGRILAAYPGLRLGTDAPAEWAGRDWNDVVSPETRPKVRALLEEGSKGVSRFRQLNHPLPSGREIPVGYTAIRVGDGSRLLAVGKDLQSLAELQQQLVEAQRAMESEYWQVRQAEARYRLLFQRSSEAVFLVDLDDLRIADANNAAASILGLPVGRLVGRPFPPSGLRVADGEPGGLRAAVERLARTGGGSARLPAMVGGGEAPWVVRLSVLRYDEERVVLVRLTPERDDDAVTRKGVDVVGLLERAPDGFVVADLEGNVLTANGAFVRMAQLASAREVEGRSLGLWLGRPGADLTVLLTALRNGDPIRFFSTTIQGEHGLATDVEVSAVSAPDAEVPCMGIVLRDVSSRLGNRRSGVKDLNRVVEDLTSQVGRVSLKRLVEDTVSLVELHFIDAALQLTGGNRTAAAELLGLSRQSLYTKLRRYNLDGPDNTG